MDEAKTDHDFPTVVLAWQRLRSALGAAGMGTWHVDLASGVRTHDESLNHILGQPPTETATKTPMKLPSSCECTTS